MATDQVLAALAFALGGMLLGALLLRALTAQDHRTWVRARAPGLPIRVLAAGDDAWVRGAVRSASPLVCPHFGVACVSYSYAREREHTWTTQDKDGKTQHHSEWRTEHSESEAIDFELDDGERIVVRAADATNEAEDSLDTDYESGSLRHTGSALEVGAVISVLGVKQDDGSLGAQREVPCLWTRATREESVSGSSGSETGLFFFACLLAFAGGAAGGAWLVAAANPEDAWVNAAGETRSPFVWAWLLPAGLATWLPIWWLGVHNRFVRLRQQVAAAFRQVDVDLAVRADLVPNLVAVVRAHAGHEKTLLESLAAIRSGRDPNTAAAAEPAAADAARAVLVLHERFPELRSDRLYLDLHDRLWAIEEKLAHTRSLYNDVVTEWNDRVAKFPQNVVARLMRCREAPLFAGDDAPLPPRLRD